MALPHLAWPYQLGLTVSQDSSAEHRAAAAVLACTQRGRVDGLPTFGVSTPLFGTQPVDAALMAAQVGEYDPRLAPHAQTIIDLTQPDVAHVQVGVTAGDQST